MTPADPTFIQAGELFDHALETSTSLRLDWEPNEVAVIDNWRILHGRAGGDDRDTDSRRLERVLVR
jgi:alpha-ketoglutarate-dependent taurine dioxygenase